MALTAEDREWIREELKRQNCGCGLSLRAQKEMPHFTGMLKDVGDGEYDKGIETFRIIGKRNNAYIRWMRRIEAAGVATVTGYIIVKICEIVRTKMGV